MPRVILRPGLLDRLQSNSGIVDDDAFAATLRTSRTTLERARRGDAPSLGFIAGVAKAFGLSLGEVAEVIDDEVEAAAS